MVMVEVMAKVEVMAIVEEMVMNLAMVMARLLVAKDFEDYLLFFWESFSSFQPLAQAQE